MLPPKTCFFGSFAVTLLRYALVFVIGLVSATEARGQWEIGGCLGLNMASQVYQQDGKRVREKVAVLPHFGVMGVYNLGPNMAVQPELLFSTLGTKHSLRHTYSHNTLGEHTDELQYLMLPVTMVGRIALSRSRQDYLVVGGGPYVAWLTYAESTKKGETFTDDLEVDDGQFADYRTFDAGLSMRMVYEVRTSGKHAGITPFAGIVVTYGMLNVLPHGDATTGRYNRAVSLTFGVRMRIGGQKLLPEEPAP